jgi:hypothetical protein
MDTLPEGASSGIYYRVTADEVLVIRISLGLTNTEISTLIGC